VLCSLYLDERAGGRDADSDGSISSEYTGSQVSSDEPSEKELDREFEVDCDGLVKGLCEWAVSIVIRVGLVVNGIEFVPSKELSRTNVSLSENVE